MTFSEDDGSEDDGSEDDGKMSEAEDGDAEFGRTYWHSRRGLWELDLLLVPFVREHYAGLGTEDRARYRQLLDAEDRDLLAWFMAGEVPGDAGLSLILRRILDASNTGRFPR